MSAYVASGRIDRVAPRLVIGRHADGETDAWAPMPVATDDVLMDLSDAPIDDPLVELLIAARERWSQLTFYLFDAEGWR